MARHLIFSFEHPRIARRFRPPRGAVAARRRPAGTCHRPPLLAVNTVVTDRMLRRIKSALYCASPRQRMTSPRELSLGPPLAGPQGPALKLSPLHCPAHPSAAPQRARRRMPGRHPVAPCPQPLHAGKTLVNDRMLQRTKPALYCVSPRQRMTSPRELSLGPPLAGPQGPALNSPACASPAMRPSRRTRIHGSTF